MSATYNNKPVTVHSHALGKLVAGAIALSWFIAFAGPASADSGDFAASCRDLDSDGAELTAQCRRVDGSMTFTSIDLSRYVANDNGRLVRRDDGHFDASCDAISVSCDGVLEAQCRKRDGQTWRYTELDLNEFLANFNGELDIL
jgi:hypothetical protein